MPPEKPLQAVREIRVNPVVPSESVLIATARGLRPREKEDPVARDTRTHVPECPFCTGNEAHTPPTIVADPADDAHWRLRVVENLFPVLGTDDRGGDYGFGLQRVIAGYGHHEVIIDHRMHGIAIHEMEPDHLIRLLKMYRARMRTLYDSDPRVRYVLVFKNFGPAAGASMRHTHSQVVALPVVPDHLHHELIHSRNYYHERRHCVFCALIDEAIGFEATLYDHESGEVRRTIRVGQYVVERGRHFLAIKPFASRFEWEMHILPLQHASDFTDTADDRLADLAEVLVRTMARLDAVIGGAQYNYFLHARPRDPAFADCAPSFHWHLEICPRTSIPSGFELGSGLYVNTISPEDAAQRLRNIHLASG